jgi:hypothetical protein
VAFYDYIKAKVKVKWERNGSSVSRAKKLHDTKYVLSVFVLKQTGIVVVSTLWYKLGFRQIPCKGDF